jgi:hypothetical protein
MKNKNLISKYDFSKCLAFKPTEGFIIHCDENGKEIYRERVGKPTPDWCPFCFKLWEEH